MTANHDSGALSELELASSQSITARVYRLTCDLVRRASITPADEGCQPLLNERLIKLGFSTRSLDANGVTNTFAWREAANATPDTPHLMFAGHTDVVPTGPLDEWRFDPFEPELSDGMLYGRGTADMKASLAAMVVALEETLAQNPKLPLNLSLLITSDEEGVATHGTRYAVEQLNAEGIRPDYCIVGEPSSATLLGDTVRCGRRGSINAVLRVEGIQGHVAYPDDANNPIHAAMSALDELAKYEWDTGNDYYPATSLQISNINAGTGATNIIPGSLEVQFNLRFNTEQSSDGIQRIVGELLSRHDFKYSIEWVLSGQPFLTEHGVLTGAVEDAISHVAGIKTELSTSGGTSDGRFIAPWAASAEKTSPQTHPAVEVVELGPLNATIHKINECVAVADLGPLTEIYAQVLQNLANQPLTAGIDTHAEPN